MVTTQTRQNIFWVWSNAVDFQKRGDATYWLPSYTVLTKNKLQHRIADIAELSELRFDPTDNPDGHFHYIDISNVDVLDGAYTKTLLQNADAPSRARKKLEQFDVIVSTVRPNRNATAIVLEKEKTLVGSTGFAVLKPKKINPYYLFAFTKSRYFIDQLVRNTSATMYPAVNEKDVANAKILIPSRQQQEVIATLIVKAYQHKQQSEADQAEAQSIFENQLKQFLPQWSQLKEPQKKVSFWLWSNEIEMTSRLNPDYYLGKGIIHELGKTLSISSFAKAKIGRTPAYDDYVETGGRILKFRAITGAGIDWENKERGYVKENFFEKTQGNRIQENDIVLGSAAHQAHYIGRYIDVVDEIPKEFESGVLTVAEILTIRVERTINPYVLLLFLRSKVGYELIQQQIKGQTSHLYPKDVERMVVPEVLIKISQSSFGAQIESKIKLSLRNARFCKLNIKEAVHRVEGLIVK